MIASLLRRVSRPASLPSSPRARRLLVVSLAAPLLVGCNNFDAQTNAVYTPAQGVNNREATVDVLNALVVAESDGTGRLIAGLANNDGSTEIALSGVQGVGEDEGVQFGSDGGTASVGPSGFLQLADEGSAVITASGDGVEIGDYVRLSMSFDNGETVDLNVPVVPPGEDFAEVTLPSDSPTTEG